MFYSGVDDNQLSLLYYECSDGVSPTDSTRGTSFTAGWSLPGWYSAYYPRKTQTAGRRLDGHKWNSSSLFTNYVVVELVLVRGRFRLRTRAGLLKGGRMHNRMRQQASV